MEYVQYKYKNTLDLVIEVLVHKYNLRFRSHLKSVLAASLDEQSHQTKLTGQKVPS